MEREKIDTTTPSTRFFFPLLQLVLVLLLLRDFLWQREWIISGNKGGDVFVQFYAWRQFAANHLLAGEFPFWNPHIFGGIPFFGGMQSALLYPLNALYLFLPMPVAINWSIALHLWLMGFFTTLWLHHGVKVSRIAAGMGGIMMMFSGPFFMHIHGGQLSNLSVMIWVPLLLLAVDRWFAGEGPRWLAMGAITVAMQIFAGHPQYLYYTGITILLYGLVHLVRHSHHRLRDAAGIFVLYLTGALLGAVQLLPGAEAAAASVRGNGVSADFAGSVSLTPFNIATLISPHMLDLAIDKTWLWETVLYFGVIGLVLALIGSGQRTHARVMNFVLLMVLLFILALGSNTPLFPLLLKYVPGFDLFRGTTKFAFFSILFAITLAAIGIDRLRRSPPEEKRRFVPPLLVSAASLAVSLLVLHSLMGNPESSNALFAKITGKFIITFDLAVVVVLLASSALLFWYQGPYARHALKVLLVMLTIELFVNGATHLPRFNEGEILRHPIVESLRVHPGEERVLDLDYRNAAMMTGSYELWGNDPGVSKRWAEFVAATQGFKTPEHQNVYFSGLAPQLAIARLQWRLRTTPDGVVQVTQTDSEPFPHAMLFHSVEVASQDAVLKRLADPAFDFRHTLLVEDPLSAAPKQLAPESVTILSTSINALELRISNTAPAVMLITDAYDKGWRAISLTRGNPQDYQVIPADHAFIGIPLKAGEHHILLEYRPRTFTAGLLLSATGALLCMALVWLRSPTRAKMATL